MPSPQVQYDRRKFISMLTLCDLSSFIAWIDAALHDTPPDCPAVYIDEQHQAVVAAVALGRYIFDRDTFDAAYKAHFKEAPRNG
jgi:hypothetical protein